MDRKLTIVNSELAKDISFARASAKMKKYLDRSYPAFHHAIVPTFLKFQRK